jgi:hypothetical protein
MNLKRILLTGGRAPATLELARLLHKAGHSVFIAESVKHHLTHASRAITRNYLVPPPRFDPEGYVAALMHIIEQEHIDLLVPTCEEVFYVSWGYERLAAQCQVFVEPLSKLQPLHSKWEFVQRAQQYGLNVPRTTLLNGEADLRRALLNPPLVLKPVFSRFAAKTIFWRSQRPTPPPIAPTPQTPWVAQQFIAGQQICTYSLVHAGRLAAHAAYPTEFTAGQGATILFRPIAHPAARGWVQTFVERENFTGQIAFDFIETPTGELFALECNPRATSGLHLLRDNPRLAEAFWDIAPKMIEPPAGSSAMLATAMLLYALPSALRGSWARLQQWAAAFVSSRDVIFDGDDLWPTLFQFIGLATFIWRGWRNHLSPLEASTWDIEWNGEAIL